MTYDGSILHFDGLWAAFAFVVMTIGTIELCGAFGFWVQHFWNKIFPP